MAGDWIKFEKATLDKPEVLAIAETLTIRADEVVGKLLRVWCWFDGNTENGNVACVTPVTLGAHINKLADIAGFAEAMRKVGWLNGTAMPKFERHNGESAKKRALTKERVQRFRETGGNASSVDREEKRREEVKESTALSGKAPDEAKPDLTKERRNAAVEIGKRCIAYLNERAGTSFRITEVNVSLPRARILGEGATEADLRAVVDAKVAEWGADPEMRKFLRPSTLFNREKFAQYVGQLASKLPEPEKRKRVGIYMKHASGKLDGITQIFVPALATVDHGSIAKDIYLRHGVQMPSTARYIVIDVDGGDRHTFSFEELR